MSFKRNIVTSAIVTKNIKLFNSLIDMNFDVSYQKNLIYAMDIVKINKYFFKTLLKNYYFKGNKTRGLKYILHSISTKNYYCLKRLIREGYNIEAISDYDSALFNAILKNDYHAISIILKEAYKLYKDDPNYFLEIVNEEISEYNENELIDKYSLLGFSVSDEKIFELLLHYGADLNYVDLYNQTILYTTCLEEKTVNIVKILNLLNNNKNQCFCNQFHRIPGAYEKSQDDPESSIQINCSKDSTDLLKLDDRKNNSEFEICCGQLSSNLGKYINYENIFGCTPLFEIIQIENIKIAEILLQNGADPNYISNSNILYSTCLHEACLKNNMDMINLLLKFNSNVNILNFAKQSPIYQAISNNNIELISYLLENNARIDIQDENNICPRLFAKNNRNILCLKEMNWFARKNFIIVLYYSYYCNNDFQRANILLNSPFKFLNTDMFRIIASYL